MDSHLLVVPGRQNLRRSQDESRRHVSITSIASMRTAVKLWSDPAVPPKGFACMAINPFTIIA